MTVRYVDISEGFARSCFWLLIIGFVSMAGMALRPPCLGFEEGVAAMVATPTLGVAGVAAMGTYAYRLNRSGSPNTGRK